MVTDVDLQLEYKILHNKATNAYSLSKDDKKYGNKGWTIPQGLDTDKIVDPEHQSPWRAKQRYASPSDNSWNIITLEIDSRKLIM